MIEAWFEIEQAKYVSMVAFSALVALLSPLIAKGAYRSLVLTIWLSLAGLGFVLLALTGIAHLVQQPPYVVETLFKGGITLSIAFSVSLIGVLRSYREAEHRKILAHDL